MCHKWPPYALIVICTSSCLAYNISKLNLLPNYYLPWSVLNVEQDLPKEQSFSLLLGSCCFAYSFVFSICAKKCYFSRKKKILYTTLVFNVTNSLPFYRTILNVTTHTLSGIASTCYNQLSLTHLSNLFN